MNLSKKAWKYSTYDITHKKSETQNQKRTVVLNPKPKKNSGSQPFCWIEPNPDLQVC